MLLLRGQQVGCWFHVYSIGYMHGDRSMWRFFAYLNLFMFSMLLLILGDNFLMLYVGWRRSACAATRSSASGTRALRRRRGEKAFVVNRIGDFGFGSDHDDLDPARHSSFTDVFARIGTARGVADHRDRAAPLAGAVSEKKRAVPPPCLAAGRDGGPTPVSA